VAIITPAKQGLREIALPAVFRQGVGLLA